MKVGLALFMSFMWWNLAFSKSRMITMDEVRKHHTAQDCWMVIDGKVYDLTGVLSEHRPKCEEIDLTSYCGKDAAQVWHDKEKSSKPHKKKSHLLMSKELLGTILD